MASFKDADGRDWSIRLTHADTVRVKAATGVSLYHLLDDKMKGLNALLTDPEKFVGAVFTLCERQAEKAQVSPEAFGGALDGPALEAMAEAFLEGLADFFPSRREALQKLLAKMRQVSDLMRVQALAELEAADPAALAEAAVKALKGNPGPATAS